MEVTQPGEIHVIKIVNSIFSSYTYVLDHENTDNVWLIDCGDITPIRIWLEENRKSVKGVLLTHIHFDHIYGLNELLGLFPDCRIYTNTLGKEALQNPRRNMSRYHNVEFILNAPENVTLVKEGDSLHMDHSLMATLIETPGHNNTCITWMIDNMLFTGDAYIPGIKIVTKLPTGNARQAKESLSRILIQAKGRSIYPGHEISL